MPCLQHLVLTYRRPNEQQFPLLASPLNLMRLFHLHHCPWNPCHFNALWIPYLSAKLDSFGPLFSSFQKCLLLRMPWRGYNFRRRTLRFVEEVVHLLVAAVVLSVQGYSVKSVVALVIMCSNAITGTIVMINLQSTSQGHDVVVLCLE